MAALSWVDWVVFWTTIAISASIGIVFSLTGGKQKTTTEYLVADRSMHILPVSLSMIVSIISGIMALGFTAEVYDYGIQLFLVGPFASLAMVVAALVFVPFIRKLEIVSCYEYLEHRFQSTIVRMVGSFFGILSAVIYIGVASYAPSLAVEAVTAFPLWASILITIGISTFYTALGGMKAVLWSDTFQFVIMFGGILAVLIRGYTIVGGFELVWDSMDKGQRLNFFDAMVAQIPFYLMLFITSFLVGSVVYTFYSSQKCDPVKMGYVGSSNHLLPYFVTEIMADLPGIPGLFMAALFSGTLSSNSTSLNGLAANLWEDFLKSRVKLKGEWQAALINRISVVVFGVLGIAAAFLCLYISGPITQIFFTMHLVVQAPQHGMFVVGCMFPWVNAAGALTGAAVSFGVLLWVVIGKVVHHVHSFAPYIPPVQTSGCPALNGSLDLFSNASTLAANRAANMFTHGGMSESVTLGVIQELDPPQANELQGLENLYGIAYFLYWVFGLAIAVIVALVVSLLTGANKAENVNPKLTLPIIQKLIACCSCKKSKNSQDDIDLNSLSMSKDAGEINKAYIENNATSQI